jgi:hypothetical protein
VTQRTVFDQVREFLEFQKQPPRFASLEEATEAGIAAARSWMDDSTLPVFLRDEGCACPFEMSYAMGWNSVWASDENRARLKQWREEQESERSTRPERTGP